MRLTNKSHRSLITVPLRCLRALHAAGFIHNDVKPGNILLGQEESETKDTPHLVDFGTVTRRKDATAAAQDEKVEAVVPAAIPKRVPGSQQFASITAHEGLRPTRAVDDLESLVYVLLFLKDGKLPWAGERYEEVPELKRQMLASDLSKDEDEGLAALWTQVRECREAGAIDYEACLACLGAARSMR